MNCLSARREHGLTRSGHTTLFRHSGSLVIRTHHEYGGIDSMVCPNETTSGPI